MLHFAEVKILASASLENVENIQASCLEVRSCVIRFGNKKLAGCSIIARLEHIADLQKLLLDGPEKIQSWLDLSFWIVRLHRGGDHGDEPALAGHLGGGGDHRHIDIGLTTNLLLWNNDLGRKGILGIWYGVIHQTYAANNFPSF